MALDNAIWMVSGDDIIRLAPNPAGIRFTALLDAAVRAHCQVFGIPAEAIETNIRVNQPDGGVDTNIRAGIASDPIGWMLVPTAWQYKSVAHVSISENDLIEEITKSYAAACIRAGSAYRLAIRDSLTSEKRNKWEKTLLAEARKIRADAEAPRVLDANDVAAWVRGSHSDNACVSILTPAHRIRVLPGNSPTQDQVGHNLGFGK